MPDLNVRERWVLAPIIAVVVFLGFYPAPALDLLQPGVDRTMALTGSVDPQPEIQQAAEEGQQ
jgi:NADH-quinone oxidoreductase subunit M